MWAQKPAFSSTLSQIQVYHYTISNPNSNSNESPLSFFSPDADSPNHIKVWPIQDQSGSISPRFSIYYLLRAPSTCRSQFVLVRIQLEANSRRASKRYKKTKKPSIPISSFEIPRSFIALKIQEICVFALRFHTLLLT